MRITFYEIMPGEQEAFTAALGNEHTLRFTDQKLTHETAELGKDSEIISVFVGSELRRPVLELLPTLKLIATRSMGFDHIDVPFAKERGISVANVTTYAAHPVAEFTFALLLAGIRNIFPAYAHLRDSTSYDTRGLQGRSLFGATLGVIGTGRIGKNVATLGQAFGMTVIANDARPDEAWGKEHAIPYLSLQDLLAQSDVISLHVPYMKETHHLMNAETFAQVKRGAFLVNTARGEIVDTIALLAALNNGILSGAALDVLEQERALAVEMETVLKDTGAVDFEILAANNVLIDLPNVLVTPHIAYNTAEAMQEITRVTIQSIQNFAAGTPQQYV